jgi:DNA (cytosine-5)-methyltransferase 1
VTRPPVIRAFLGDEVIADSFAGGGGVSTGIEMALGRSPDLAVNHDPEAIAMHRANHPTTEHRIESVWQVDPRTACHGKPVALAWFSPDCKHHSKAKGGKPRDQRIRGLAWVAVRWAFRVAPRVIILENVEEFRDWGPLHRRGADAGKPIKARRGELFRRFVNALVDLGYTVEHRLLLACDYGAPTKRRRLFLIARHDGLSIRWPAPTHGPEHTGRPHRHRTAAEVIDWSIPCPSIFERAKPHAKATRARVARGVNRFVLEAPRPFFVHLTHGMRGMRERDIRVHDSLDPLPTITGANRGELALVVPSLVHCSNGERPGQAPRIYDIQQPHPTIVAQGLKTSLVVAHLAKHYGERRPGEVMGQQLDLPIGAVTTRDHHALVAASLVKFYGTSSARPVSEPLDTVTAGGWKHGLAVANLVRYNGDRPEAERIAALDEPLGAQDTSRRYALSAAFLSRYNGQSIGQLPSDPIGTLDTRDRYGLVETMAAEWTPEIERKAHRVYEFMVAHGYDGPAFDHERRLVMIHMGDGCSLVVFDIGMRMLVAPELFAAQGFPRGYKIDPIGPNGKPLTKTAQIRMCGNAVPPHPVEALVRAQFPEAA